MPKSVTDFTELQFENVLLRKMSVKDSPAVYLLRKDPVVARYLDRPPALSEDEARAFIKKINKGVAQKKWYYWAITLPPERELTGTICLWQLDQKRTTAEVGYELLPAFWGRGIMHQAMSAVIGFAFSRLKLSNITAFTHSENRASLKLLKNHGFLLKSRKADSVIYILYKNDIPR